MSDIAEARQAVHRGSRAQPLCNSTRSASEPGPFLRAAARRCLTFPRTELRPRSRRRPCDERVRVVRRHLKLARPALQITRCPARGGDVCAHHSVRVLALQQRIDNVADGLPAPVCQSCINERQPAGPISTQASSLDAAYQRDELARHFLFFLARFTIASMSTALVPLP